VYSGGVALPMTDKTKILLIEDNPADQRMVELNLRRDCPGQFDLICARTLQSALELLEKDSSFDVVLIDLSLADGYGFDSVYEVQKLNADLPVILLADKEDNELAAQVMQVGAQDYLVKGQGDGHLIRRATRYAMERKSNEQGLITLAQYDNLTGLANRVLFRERLNRAMIRASRQESLVALMFIDLDRFKNINDTLGHDAGDNLLKIVANRLSVCMRKGDTVARLGGDEFTVILEDINNVDDVATIAKKLMQSMQMPLELDGHEVFITPSMGITLYPLDDISENNMLKNADTAMYQAKERGRNCFQFYTSGMNHRTIERLQLESKLRGALENDEFVLYYQPKMDFRTQKVIGAEALIRWQHPELGMVPPADFIPLAEETGLIVPMGEWVLDEACRQVAIWREMGIDSLRMAVNISARQFRETNIVQMILSTIKRANILASNMEIEITESLLMEDTEANNAILRELKSHGLHISMDDFGTGYSSLSYLRRLNVDTLKIDRSFVRDILTNHDDAVIAEAIIALGHGLRLNIVAEGVETEAQFKFLSLLHCDEAQGFYFSKPLPKDEFTAFVMQHNKSSDVVAMKRKAS
jgi:diguanylate cyclase (GGDEF)-like protein